MRAFRYDVQRKQRYKTVEIIAAEIDWVPRRKNDKVAGVRVRGANQRSRGGPNKPEAGGTLSGKVWELGYDQVVALGLEVRIVPIDTFRLAH